MSIDEGKGLILRINRQLGGFALSLDVSLPGQGVTALFGPSGSGKTSCLRAVAGLIGRHQGAGADCIIVQGEVWQDDANGTFLPTHQRAVGYVFQEASLFPHLDVAGNIAFGQRRVPAALRRVSLDQAVSVLGIGGLMARAVQTLSGGERQRVAIARALATSPKLLLMDEPLAALDAARKAEVLPYLERLHREVGIPMLYVSHAADEVARLADHLVLLDMGKALASGATAELMTRLDLPLAHGDAAAALIPATVVAHDDQFHLTQVRFEGGDLQVARQALAPGAPLRLRVQARDVSLTLQRQAGTSIQNILACTVDHMAPDNPGQVMVRLHCGGTMLLARITAKSAHELGLTGGLPVFAQIKGVAIAG